MKNSVMERSVRSLPRQEAVLKHFIPIIGAILLGVLFMIDRWPPIDTSTLIGYPQQAEVRPLEELVIEWEVIRNRTCPISVQRELIDSMGKIHRFESSFNPRIKIVGYHRWHSRLTIPAEFAWGTARYRSTISYYCGVLGSVFPIVINSPEVEFRVIPPS